jgi:GDP-4-dehydro-6-deoxy-D-mannose reductase
MANATVADSPSIFNVASGTGTSLRWVVDELCRLAEVAPQLVTAPELVRRDDPPRIVGDATALREAVGWQPQIPLTQTLADMLASSARRPAPQPA